MYKRKSDTTASKYKRKSGYQLKKGESGEMRWHKLKRTADTEETPSGFAPAPSPTYRRKSREGEPPAVSGKELLKRGRIQPSIKLYDAHDMATELNRQTAPLATRVLDRYLAENGTPELKSAARDTEWLRDNTFGTGGIGSPFGIGLKNALLEYDQKLAQVQTTPDPFDKFALSYNNTDDILTPHLPDIHDAINKEKASSSPLYREYEKNLGADVGSGVELNSVDRINTRRIIGARILERFPLLRDRYKFETYKQYDGEQYDIFGPNRETVPKTIPLLRATAAATSLRSLTGSFAKQEENSLNRLAKMYHDNTTNEELIDLDNYNFDRVNGISVDSRQIYEQDIDQIMKSIDRVGREKPRAERMMTEFIDVAMPKQIDKQIESSAGARLFTGIVVNNLIDSIDIQDTIDPKLKTGQTTADELKESLKMSYIRGTKSIIHGDTEKMLTAFSANTRVAHDKEIWIDSEERLPGFYQSTSGSANISVDSLPLNTRIDDRLLPGYDSVALHEQIHAMDNFSAIVSHAVTHSINAFGAKFLDTNAATMGRRSFIQAIGNPSFESSNDIVFGNKELATNKITKRLSLIQDIAKVATSVLNRNKNEKDFYDKHAVNAGIPGTRRTTIIDTYPSPLFYIPEFARLAYILSSSKEFGTNVRPSDANGFYIENNPDLEKQRNAHVLTPEVITVLTEHAIAAPHVLEALDTVYGTELRKNLNEYYGYSVVQKSDPTLLANSMVNLIAATENPDSILRGVIEQTKADVKKHEFVAYQGKSYRPDVINTTKRGRQ